MSLALVCPKFDILMGVFSDECRKNPAGCCATSGGVEAVVIVRPLIRRGQTA
jgi:hypothetical protein